MLVADSSELSVHVDCKTSRFASFSPLVSISVLVISSSFSLLLVLMMRMFDYCIFSGLQYFTGVVCSPGLWNQLLQLAQSYHRYCKALFSCYGWISFHAL